MKKIITGFLAVNFLLFFVVGMALAADATTKSQLSKIPFIGTSKTAPTTNNTILKAPTMTLSTRTPLDVSDRTSCFDLPRALPAGESCHVQALRAKFHLIGSDKISVAGSYDLNCSMSSSEFITEQPSALKYGILMRAGFLYPRPGIPPRDSMVCSRLDFVTDHWSGTWDYVDPYKFSTIVQGTIYEVSNGVFNITFDTENLLDRDYSITCERFEKWEADAVGRTILLDPTNPRYSGVCYYIDAIE